jgi:hypothetical protein
MINQPEQALALPIVEPEWLGRSGFGPIAGSAKATTTCASMELRGHTE